MAHSQLSNAASYAKIGLREVLALVDIGIPIIQAENRTQRMKNRQFLDNQVVYVDKHEHFPWADLYI